LKTLPTGHPGLDQPSLVYEILVRPRLAQADPLRADLLQADQVPAVQVLQKPAGAVPGTATRATPMASGQADPGIENLLQKPALIC
jgi:hypothetical protein